MSLQRRIAIVGGGIVGLSAAYSLMREGADVTVIEARSPGAGSSSGNAGMVVPSHFIPLAAPGVVAQGLKWMFDPLSPLYIKPHFDPSLLSWLWRLSRCATERRMRAAMPVLRDLCQESVRLYDRLASEEHLDFGWTKRGLLMLFRTPHGEEHVRHEAALARTIDVEAQVLSRSELERLEPRVPFGAEGGAYYPGDAHLVPERLIEALTGLLRMHGVRFMTDSAVTGLSVSSSGLESIETPGGRIIADEYVIAAGAWSAPLLRTGGFKLPLQPGKGYSVTLRTPPLALTIPSILTEARVAVTPMRDALRVAGTMEFSGLSTEINGARVNAILNALPRYYPGFRLDGVDASPPWSGLRPCSPDGLPYIGRFTSCRNMIVATGHAMLGVTLGPVTGMIVAHLVAGTSPGIDLSPLDPERFG